MNIAIIDDDLIFLKHFNLIIHEYTNKIFEHFTIDTYNNTDFLQKYYNIYFIDIDLIDKNGIDFAIEIKKYNKNALIIFVTSKNNLIFNAIVVQPFYFIRKSNLKTDVNTAFMLLKDYFNKKQIYSFKYESMEIKLFIDDIIYFETNDHLTTIYTTYKQYHIYKSLKSLLTEINSWLIIQVNRKQCVNIDYITDIKYNFLTLNNQIKIKIGKIFKINLNNRINDRMNQRSNYDI